MPVEFGLSQKDISDKQFLYLLKKENLSKNSSFGKIPK